MKKKKFSTILDILKQKYYSDDVLKIEWIIAILTAFVMYVAFIYIDLKSYTIWSLDLLDVVFDRRIFELYEYAAQNVYGAPHQYLSGNFFSLIPWAVWNIPIWVLQRFFGWSVNEYPFMFTWSKFYLVIITVLTMYFTYKMVVMLTGNVKTAWRTLFLSLTYPFMYIGVLYSGQSNIISVFFFVMALYFLLSGKKNAFILFSSMAIAAKPFYLLSYIAIILLIEKNIFKILWKVIAGCGITILFGVIFHNAPMYAEANASGPTSELLSGALSNGFTSVGFTAPYFIIVLVFFYFYAYIKKPDRELWQYGRQILFCSVAPIMFYFIFADSFEHYRLILLSPLLFILFALNKSWYRMNILITVIVTMCALICITVWSEAMFSTNSMDGTFLTKVFGETLSENRVYPCISHLLNAKVGEISVYAKVLSGIFVAGNLLLIGLNCPSIKCKSAIEENRCERWLIWCHMLMVVPFVLVTILCYYKI